MIVFSDQHLLPCVGGVVTLGKPGEYVYVARTEYDAAVVLGNRYKNKERLMQELGTAKNGHVIDFFYDEAPAPINILAPYLAFAHEPEELTLETCCGILHVLTKSIDVLAFPSCDASIRRAINIYVDPEETYILQWRMLIKEWFSFDEINGLADKVTLLSKIPEAPTPQVMIPPMYPYQQMPFQPGGYPMAYPDYNQQQPLAMQAPDTNVQSEDNVQVVGVNEDGEIMIAIEEDDDDLDAFLRDALGDDDEVEEPKETKEVKKTINTPEPEPVKEEVPPQNGLDRMKNLLLNKK